MEPSTSSAHLTNSKSYKTSNPTTDIACTCRKAGKLRVQKMHVAEHQLKLSQQTKAPWLDAAKKLFIRAISMPTETINYLSETRFGIAKLVGYRLISAQMYEAHNPTKSREIIETACQAKHPDGYRVEKISMSYGAVSLDGVICYPDGYGSSKNSDCILYNNPNAYIISQFFDNNKLAVTPEEQIDGGDITQTPGNMLKLKKSPIILYDYRGTGINRTEGYLGLLPTATSETVIQDGITALHYALSNFSGNICILGSSMGGGISTIAVANYLDAIDNPQSIENRLTLINHDSYTTTSRVMMPEYPYLADTIGATLGSQIDAEEAMQCLGKRSIKVVVLAHEQDSVIDKRARMVEFLPKSATNISSFISNQNGTELHARLSIDQVKEVSKHTKFL